MLKWTQVCVGKHTGARVIKVRKREGEIGSKVQTNSSGSSLNKLPHFGPAFTSKRRLSEPQSHLSLQPLAVPSFLHFQHYLKEK